MLAASCSPALEVGDATVWRCLLALFCRRFNLPAVSKANTSRTSGSFVKYVRDNVLCGLSDVEIERFFEEEAKEAAMRIRVFW